MAYEEKRNKYNALFGKPEGTRPLGRPRRRSKKKNKIKIKIIIMSIFQKCCRRVLP